MNLTDIFVNIFIIAFLLFVNGFFVSAEFALVKVRKTRIEQLVKEGSFSAKLALNAINDLDKFIKEKGVEFTKNLINMENINEAQNYLGITFGSELKEYILEYGYLAYEYAELYGINSIQLMESDMIKETKRLHELFPKTANLIIIENQGDGDYYLVDSNDNVYEYISDIDELTDVKMSLFDYILNRFTEVDSAIGS